MSTPVLDVYLTFDGNTREAMQFYADTIGGQLQAMMTFGEMPGGAEMCANMPANAKDRIMHSTLMIGDRSLMASDGMPGQAEGGQKNVSLTLTYDTADEAKRMFEKLSAGGEVMMPMDEAFWAEAFGMCKDKFGTHWLINGGMKPFGG